MVAKLHEVSEILKGNYTAYAKEIRLVSPPESSNADTSLLLLLR